MPSRGAFPFLQGAQNYLYLVSAETQEPFTMPRYRIGPLKEIWLPFTAYPPPRSGISSAGLRAYWCRVLSGIMAGGDDTDLRLHKFIAGHLFGQRTDQLEFDPKQPAGLVILDTVISGRSAYEISTALDGMGLENYLMLLAVDREGTKLTPRYKAYLRKLQHEGRAKLFYVKNIFTEDSHHGLSGITSVVFPELIAALSFRCCSVRPLRDSGIWRFLAGPK